MFRVRRGVLKFLYNDDRSRLIDKTCEYACLWRRLVEKFHGEKVLRKALPEVVRHFRP